MEVRTVWALSVLLIIFSIMGGGITGYASHSIPELTCGSDFHIHSGNESLKMDVSFELTKGEGIITLNGKYFSSGKEITSFWITKLVSYEINGMNLKLIKKKDSLSFSEETPMGLMRKYIAAFFTDDITQNYMIRVEKLEGTESAWLLSSSRTPYFICTKS